MTEFTEKRKRTCLKKYGNEIYQRTNMFQKKRKETCLQKYGYETPLSCPEIREKIYKSIDREKKRENIKKSRNLEREYNGDFYSKEETINLCKSLGEEYFGSGGYRKLIKNDKKLYFSILEYSKEMENVKYGSGFVPRVRFLLGEFKRIQCPYCGNYLKYDCGLSKIMYICHKCKLPKVRSEEYCLLNDLNYEEEKKRISEIAKKSRKKIKGPNINSKEFYIKKYGESEGIKKYISHSKNVTLSNHKYSKESKEFFDTLVSKTNLDRELCFYAETEKRFELSKDEQKILNRTCIYPDFLVGNKIIEYNGSYWHRNEQRIQDFNRKLFFENLGYDVLTVWNKTEGELDRAIKFINSGRYKVLTSDGYSDFDGISKKIVNKTLNIVLENNKCIEVSENHNFIIQNVTVRAKTLKIGDCLELKDNILERIIDIKILNEKKEVYDILETKNHSYYANDILNHNCQFLGSSYTLLNPDVLRSFKYCEPDVVWDNMLKVYFPPVKGHKYIMGVDAAKGANDAFAVQILDITSLPFKQVAVAQIFKCNYLIMPEFICEWATRYNRAFVIVENNEGAGTFVASMLQIDYEYDNLYTVQKGPKIEAGFRTTTKTRPQILETFQHFTDNHKCEIIDFSTITEANTFIIKDNKYQADNGCHDDLIMCLALCFVPFIDNKNFDNMKELIAKIHSKDNTEVDISDYMIIGDFDDFSDDNEENLIGKSFDGEYFISEML